MSKLKGLSRPHRKRFRRMMFNLNPYCYWCGVLMILNPPTVLREELATIEHLTPLNSGGKNVVLVHKRCNR
jgi:hypothetical protein